MPGFDVVIVAGGSGRRLGGVDKGGLDVGGVSLLDRVLTASAGAARTVVVGVPRPTHRPVTWTRERPAGGGPVAGLAAGLAALDALDRTVSVEPVEPVELAAASAVPAERSPERPVVVLATDLPALTRSDLERLLARSPDLERVDAVLFEDAEGHRQPLAGLYRPDRVRAVLAELGEAHGAAMRQLVGALRVATLTDGGATADCDTPDQLRAARAAAISTRSGAGRSPLG